MKRRPRLLRSNVTQKLNFGSKIYLPFYVNINSSKQTTEKYKFVLPTRLHRTVLWTSSQPSPWFSWFTFILLVYSRMTLRFCPSPSTIVSESLFYTNDVPPERFRFCSRPFIFIRTVYLRVTGHLGHCPLSSRRTVHFEF